MTRETVLVNNKTLAVCYRKMSSKFGLNYFTLPKRSLQVAFHKYAEKRETNTHPPIFGKRVVAKNTEFVYIIKGSAVVYFSDKKGNRLATKHLKEDDGIMIIGAGHKFIFNKNTKALEVKQGPFQIDK